MLFANSGGGIGRVSFEEGVFMLQLSVVVPTFREAENLSVLIPKLVECFERSKIDGEIIVVDDNSPDDTVNVVEHLSGVHPVRLIVRKTERGLSSAVIAGMHAASGDVVLCMDADLSHPPEDVPTLFAALANETVAPHARRADFAMGSRYVAGGSTESGWGLGRWLNSKVATLLAWPLVSVSDPMAGFFALRREDFVAAESSLDPIGYKIALELLIKTNAKRVAEIPIQFKNRLHGESKLSLREQLNYVRHLGRLYRFRFPKLTRFVSFGCVGAVGAIVDLLVFVLLLQAGASAWLAAGAAIGVAMTGNFEMNRRLTFSNRVRSWPRAYLAFCLSCLVGACVNAGVRVWLMSTLSWFADHAWGAAMLGILSGMLFNFALCERFVFRRKPKVIDAAPATLSAFVGHVGSSGTKNKLSWFVRLFVASVVVLSAVLGRGHWTQLAKPTMRVPSTEINPLEVSLSTAQTPAARSALIAQSTRKGNPLSEAAVKGTPTSSSKLPLKAHHGFDFSDMDSEQRMRADARYLASDELEGRGTSTNGIDKAADFIAKEFGKSGLNTNANGKGAFHEFTLLTREASPAVSQVGLHDADSVVHALARGRDFSSILIPKPKQISGGLVFAGFGISAPELGYNDYAEIEVRGRVLIVLRSEPTHADWKSRAVGDSATHASLRVKIKQAMHLGAAAVVFCDPIGGVAGSSSELLAADFSREFPNSGMPVIHVRREVLRELLQNAAGFDLAAVEAEIQTTLKPQSQLLKNVSLSIRVERPKLSRTLKNVIATLEGKGPRSDETVVIGAHYDHLGYGGWGSLDMSGRREIHNGADDNASGTVVMLEAARQLAGLHLQKSFARRVCFIAFSAEELGLIGSKKYTQEPRFPLETTIAMLNLDMVGRLRNDDLTVYGVGTSPVWTPWLRRLPDDHHLKLQLRQGGYGPSDHASFYERGVPVLHFFTGFHPDYHRPSDDSGLLNYQGMTTISHIVTELAFALSELPERPGHSSPPVELAELEFPIAFGDLLGAQLPTRKYQLGVQMSAKPSSNSAGVRIQGTLPGSLAERFGLRSGDVIETINGEKVSTPKEAVAQIQKHNRKEPLTVSVDRNGTLLKIKIGE